MKNVISGVIKMILLLLFDTICLLMVFSVWVIINIPLFPLAFGSIIFSLIALNLIILLSESAIQLFGLASYISMLIVTVLYYALIFIFTWATYISISPKWYLIATLTATLVYFSITAGLYISGSKKGADSSNQKLQGDRALGVKVLLMNIKSELLSLQNVIDKLNYNAIMAIFNEMEERVLASTPFGRKSEPAIDNLERQINYNLSTIRNELNLLKNLNKDTIDTSELENHMVEVKNLVYSREKIIIK